MSLEQISEQEHFSFQSCQEDDFFIPLDQSYFEFQNYYNEASLFIYGLEDSAVLDKYPQSQIEISDDLEISSTLASSNDSQKILQEKNTLETSEDQVCHYKNLRRKKHQRAKVQKVYKLGSRYSSNPSTEDIQDKKTAKLTKNLLAFGKKPHMDFILLMCGKSCMQEYPWLKNIYQSNGMTLEDYDRLYKCKELKPILEKFFSRKLLYRDLMTSRTISQNKIFYLYYLKVFQRNFRKGNFKGISETMLQIEKEKEYL